MIFYLVGGGVQAEDNTEGVYWSNPTSRPLLQSVAVLPNTSFRHRNTVSKFENYTRKVLCNYFTFYLCTFLVFGVCVSLCFFIVIATGSVIGTAVGLYSILDGHYTVLNGTTIANRQGDIIPIFGDDTEFIPKGSNQYLQLNQIVKGRNEIIPFTVYQGNCVAPGISKQVHNNDSDYIYIRRHPVPILDGLWLNKGASIKLFFLFTEHLSAGEYLEIFLSKFESCLDNMIKCVINGKYAFRYNVTQKVNNPLDISITTCGYYNLLIRSGKSGSIIQVKWNYDLNYNYYSSNNNFTTICQVDSSKPNCGEISVQEGHCYFMLTEKQLGRPQFYYYQFNATAERRNEIQKGVKYLAPLAVLGTLDIVASVVIFCVMIYFFIVCLQKKCLYNRV